MQNVPKILSGLPKFVYPRFPRQEPIYLDFLRSYDFECGINHTHGTLSIGVGKENCFGIKVPFHYKKPEQVPTVIKLQDLRNVSNTKANII